MGWSGVNFLLLLFSAVHDNFPDFWFFDPLKFPLRPPLVGGVKKLLSIFSTVHEIYRTFEICPPPWNPPPQSGMGKNKLYWFSGQFMTFPGLLIFWPPKISTATPFGGGGGVIFVIDFLDSSWNLPDFWNFDPQPPPLEPPGVGWVKTNLLIFWTVHDISRTFDFLTP